MSKLLCLSTGLQTGVFSLDSSATASNRVYIDSDTGTVVGFGDMVVGGREVETIQLTDGVCVMPGIADRHTHWLFELVGGAISMSGFVGPTAVNDFRLALKFAIANQKSGTVVFTDWNDAAMPVSAVRDIVNAESHGIRHDGREVLIFNSSWHAAYASQALLNRVMPEISAMRQAYNLQGEVRNGLVDEDFLIQVIARIEFDPAILKTSLLARQNLLLSRGVTSIYDKMVLGERLFETLTDLSMRGDLIIPTTAAIQPWMMDSAKPGQYGHFLRVAGLKLFADGAFGNRKAGMCFGHQSWPYIDNGVGVDMLPNLDVVMRDLLQWREMGGEAIFIHAIGPGAVLATAGLFDQILRKGDLGPGFTLGFEHMEACPPWVINHVADLQRHGSRVEVCSQPGFNDDLAAYPDRLPGDVLGMINPYGSFKRGGLRWTFGTDGPITGDRIFGAFAQAVKRQGPEAITVSDMLRAAIEHPLEVGKPATFIVVDRDPWGGDLGEVQVLETWIRGKRVWKRKVTA